MSKDLHTFYKFYDDGGSFKITKIMTEEEKTQFLKDNPDFTDEDKIKEREKSTSFIRDLGDWRDSLRKKHPSYYSMIKDKIKANASLDSISRQKYR